MKAGSRPCSTCRRAASTATSPTFRRCSTTSKDKPQFKVVERIKTTEQYSVMFAKDAPLAAKVNDVITELKKDGTLAKIHETWFGTKPDEGLATSTVMDMPKL